MSRYSGDVLFICQTSLHFLLVPGLSRLWDGEKSVVWVSETDVDARLVEKIRHLSDCRFVPLAGGARVPTKILRMLTRSFNVLRLRILQRRFGGGSLVVFNDLSPETQYLIHLFYRRGGKVFLGEDGVATYPTGGLVPAGIASKVLGKFLYGPWWAPKLKIGLNNKVSAVFASYPALIRGEVQQGKEIIQLPLLEFDDLDSSFDLCVQDYLLCVMPLVSSVPSEELTRFISVLKGGWNKLAIKFHPRESEKGRGQVEALLGGNSYCFIPKETPIEAICIRSIGLKEVVGYRSSALHLLKFLRPDLKVMYMGGSEGQREKVWSSFYKEVGVLSFMDESDCK